MYNEKLQQLLLTENEQLRKLNGIVVNAVEEEKLITQKLYELVINISIGGYYMIFSRQKAYCVFRLKRKKRCSNPTFAGKRATKCFSQRQPIIIYIK